MIGDFIAAEIHVDDVRKRFTTIRWAARVHDENDEAQMGERLPTGIGSKSAGYPRCLRAGVNRIEHRIFLARIEVEGFVENTVEIRLPIGGFYSEFFRWIRPEIHCGIGTGFGKYLHECAVGAAEFRLRGAVHVRMRIE